MKEIDVSEQQGVHYLFSDVLKENLASNIDTVPFSDQQLVTVRRREICKDALHCLNAPNLFPTMTLE